MGGNIYLRAEHPAMTVTEALTEGADLHVTFAGGGSTITSGYGEKNGKTLPHAFFVADDTDYAIVLDGGEVVISKLCSVSVDAKDKSRLSLSKTLAPQGDTVTVTVLDDTDPGRISVAWSKQGITHYVPFTAGAGSTGTFVMPGADVTVKINPPVTYYAHEPKTYNGMYSVVTSETTTWTSGWYVVNETVTIGQRIEVQGDVTLVLSGTSENKHCTLEANAGIHVPSGSSLTIYGETPLYGLLKACISAYALPSSCAAIGGNNGETNGPITICSGYVVASSNDSGAAIGGGSNGNGNEIRIDDGTVVATNLENGAAIGGGFKGAAHHIVVNGGDVTVSGVSGAGIGCGSQFQGESSFWQNDFKVFEINGGRLMASCRNGSALIIGDMNSTTLPLFGFIYQGAKIMGGLSAYAMHAVFSAEEAARMNVVVIEPCTHANAAWKRGNTTHEREQCPDCHMTFAEEEHTLNADGVCTVCGYDSHSMFVYFESAGSKVEAQRVPIGQMAVRPKDPVWDIPSGTGISLRIRRPAHTKQLRITLIPSSRKA